MMLWWRRSQIMSWVEDLKQRVGDRLTICKECPFFLKPTKQCKKCGCFLPAKTAIPDSTCPINKW